MTSIWDTLAQYDTLEVEPLETDSEPSSFWSAIANPTKPKVKKAKAVVTPKVKKSKAVVKSAEVYETIGGLVTPSTECTHHWVIGTATPQDIGVCKLCHGEKMFTNSFLMAFNDTPIAELHGSLGSTEGGA